MKSLKEQLGGLVYSTDKGAMCPQCDHAVDDCQCSQIADQQRLNALDGIIRIHRETKGRKGKGVTLVKGIPLDEKDLKKLSKEMKQHSGTGGALKAGVIEIQGDHRDQLKLFLEKTKIQCQTSRRVEWLKSVSVSVASKCGFYWFSLV